MSCEQARSIDLAAFVVEPQAAEFETFRAHYPGCAACSLEVERVSRLEGRLRAEAARTGHPEASALLAFEREPQALAVEQREAVAGHLEGCAACRAELRALRGFDFAAAREPGTPPSQARTPARSASAPPCRRAAAWAAAAAAVLVIGVSLSILLLRDPQPAAPPLAVVEPEPAPAAVVPPAPEPQRPPEPRIAREPAPPKPSPVQPAPSEPEPVEVVATPTAADPEPTRASPIEIAMAFPAEPLVYVPPEGVDPAVQRWRVPGVVRSAGRANVKIQALAPDHIGRTARPSPTLYWVLSAPTELRVELVLTDEVAEQPLLDVALDGAEAGVHALSLADHGVALEPGTPYRWYATLVPDPDDRSGEVVSGGAIEREAVDASFTERLAATPPGQRAHLLAGAGLFYDALDVLSGWIAEHPDAAEPRRDRSALLEAVGLGKALPGPRIGPG